MSFPEERLWDHLNDGWSRMSWKQRSLWDAIKVAPVQWELRGHGPCWVVALLGETVIYYNHFEHGFNRSTWSRLGVIDDYQALQLGLEGAVQMQLARIENGHDIGPWTSGAIPGEYSKPEEADSIRSTGVWLGPDHCNWALTREQALTSIGSLRDKGFIVLGGDVLYGPQQNYSHTYDNWFYEPSDPPVPLDVPLSAQKAVSFVTNYRGDGAFFVLVPRRFDATG